MKKKWSVAASVVASHFVGEYEAETGTEAIEMAMDDAHVSFCHQCSSNAEDPQLEKFVAWCGDEQVEYEPEMTWQEQARAAGWRPPAKKRGAHPAPRKETSDGE